MVRNSNQKRVVVTLIVLVSLLVLFYAVTNAITRITGKSVSGEVLDKDSIFKSCLDEKDITLYINTNDVVGTLKNIQLNDYLGNLKIFNCQVNNELCIQQGINGPFPTWMINNIKIESDISLKQLEDLSGCKSE